MRADSPRVSSGLRQLDVMLGGGFPAYRSVVVAGPTGAGKTTLAVQFLAEGIRRAEPGILVMVDEKPRHVLEHAEVFGWNLDAAIENKLLVVLDASPFFMAARRAGRELDARHVASDLTGHVRELQARRLVIDPVTSLVDSETSAVQAREFLRALLFSLEDNLGCTMLLTVPRGPSPNLAADIVEHLASGVLELGMSPASTGSTRTLVVRKMRGTDVEPIELPIAIHNGQGLVISN